MANTVQRKLGYRDIIYNIRTKKFYEFHEGDNYGELDITFGDDGFSGDYNDLINKPTIGDGSLTFKNSDGSVVVAFSANQDSNSEVTLPKGFSGDYDDLINKPTIGDGTISITESDGTAVGSFTVNQVGNLTIALPEVTIPDALSPKGFIDVTLSAPASPEHGDLYIQHRDDLADGVADASFETGITTGQVVEEGAFVMYGVDDLWHTGGNVDTAVGDGTLTIKNSDGTVAGTFTANQETDTEIVLPEGFSGDYNDLINQPVPFPEAPADGNVYVRNGQSTSWAQGLPYDVRTLPELP